jgi:MerR family transcriptional regulator/heat shock protein HspR
MASFRPDHGLLSISVTSELTGVNPQMLRVYEDKGLLAPHRTQGGTRRYSTNDVDRIDEITDLLGGGLNLAGVALVLELRSENRRLRRELESMRRRRTTRSTPAAAAARVPGEEGP